MDTVSASAGNISMSYHNGADWVPVVDLLDGTSGFTKSGVIQFSPNRNTRWDMAEDTAQDGPSDLNSFTIYNLYWIKIEFGSALDAGTALKKITYKFCTDAELEDYDSDIDEFLTAFSQSDWTPQILTASLEVVDDMKRKGLIVDSGQVLRLGDVARPTAYKTLLIIYLSLGDAYADRRAEVKELYKNSFSGVYTIDRNNDGLASKRETAVLSGRMHR